MKKASNLPTPKKSSLGEVELRVTEVKQLLLQGRTRSHIIQHATKWGVEASMVDKYMRRAWDVIKEINQVTIQENMALITAELWELVQMAKAEGDVANAMKGMSQLAKIKGLETLTLNVVTEPREMEEANDADVDQILEAEYEPV